MSSVLDDVVCRGCGGTFLVDFDCRTGLTLKLSAVNATET